jgi:replicative DNA helicase
MKDDRLPPHDREAERALLGCVLRDNAMLHEADAVTGGHRAFYAFGHARIFEGAADLIGAGKPADLVTLADWLVARKWLEDAGGAGYLVDLWDAAPAPGNAVRYAEIVRDFWLMRQLIHACNEIQQDVWRRAKPIAALLDDAERKLFEIARHDARGAVMHVSEITKELMEWLDQRAAGKGSQGVTTGFRDLDAYTGGWHPSNLVIIGARPSTGKTTAALNMLYAAAKAQKPALIVSIEQPRAEIVRRLLCIHGDLDGHRLRLGDINLKSQDGNRLLDASAYLDGLPAYVDDRSTHLPDIVANIRRAHAKHKIGVVFIDHLNRVRHYLSGRSKTDEVGDITGRLKDLARELEIPVVLLSQLSREVEKQNREPRLSDLRDSGCTEQDADVVLFLHRTGEETDRTRTIKVLLEKQREGPIGHLVLVHELKNYRFNNFARY